MSDIKNKIINTFKTIYPYSGVKGNRLNFSTAADKGGNPLAQINTKKPIAALSVELSDDKKEVIVHVLANDFSNAVKVDNYKLTAPRGFKIYDYKKFSGGIIVDILANIAKGI